MKTGWSIVTAFAAVGIGLGAGSWRASSDDRGRVDEIGAIEAVTFLGTGEKPRDEPSPGVRTTLNLIPYTTFAEAGDRLAELLKAYEGLNQYQRNRRPVEVERLLDEIEQILALASEAELQAFFESPVFSTRKPKHELDTEALADIAFAAFARISPSRAAEFGLPRWEKSPPDCDGLSALLHEWNRLNPAEAERWITGITNETLHKAAFHLFLIARAETNPGEIQERLAEIDPEMGYGIALTLGTTLDLAKMPETAESFLAPREDGKNAVQMLAPFLISWGGREPEAMMRWLLAQDLDALGPEAVRLSLQSIAATDPAGFLGKIAGDLTKQPALRPVAAQAWWSWLASEGGEVAAIQWMGENGEVAANFGQSPMTQFYLRNDTWEPERTTRLLEALTTVPDSSFKATFSQQLLTSLAQSDPKAVLAYAMEHLPIGSQADSTISQAVGQWAATGEAEAAIRWSLENLESEYARTSAVRYAMGHWAKTDGRAAADFAMTLEATERSSALAGIAEYWVKNDPEGVIAFLRGASNPDSVSGLTQNSFEALGQNQGGVTHFETALSMPAGKLRHNAVQGLFEGLAKSKVEDAAKAIEKVPDGTLRDAAIVGFCNEADEKDPQLCIEIMTQFSVAESRDRRLVNLGRNWMIRDPKAAEAALRGNASLSDALKARIFK